MSYSYDDVNFDSSYDFDSWVYVEMITFTQYDSDFTIDNEFNIDVCIEGNSATFAIDVQAYDDRGGATATDLTLAVFVEEGYSSIVASGYALVA